MSDSNNNSGSAGVGLSGLVFIVFLVLKLTKVINWSWWWVTAPLWIPFSIGVLLLLILGIVTFIKEVKK